MPNPVAPADDINWATDTNFTNGPAGIPGTATKVAPSAPEKAEGNIPKDKPPAQWMNWWMNRVYLWKVYFKAVLDTLSWTQNQDRVVDAFVVAAVFPTPDWGQVGAHWENSSGVNGTIVFPILGLPPGAIIQSVTFSGQNVTAGNVVLTIAEHDGFDTYNQSVGAVAGTNLTGTGVNTQTHAQVITVLGNHSYYVQIVGQQVGDKYYGAFVTYKEGGLVRTSMS